MLPIKSEKMLYCNSNLLLWVCQRVKVTNHTHTQLEKKYKNNNETVDKVEEESNPPSKFCSYHLMRLPPLNKSKNEEDTVDEHNSHLRIYIYLYLRGKRNKE